MKALVSLVTFVSTFTLSYAQILHDPNYQMSIELSGLSNPMGVSIDANGIVYIADSANGRILKGSNGNYSELISGFTVSSYFGFNIGPLGVFVAPNQTLLVGEGGGDTGEETVWHYDLNGNLIKQFNPVPFGGNWNGFCVVSSDNRLLATSSNGDKIFQATPSGNTWNELSIFIDTAVYTGVAPTGVFERNGVLYVTFHGGFFQTNGGIKTFDANTGTLINGNFIGGFSPLNAITGLPDGRLLVAEFGNNDGEGNVWYVDSLTGQTTLLVSQISHCTSVAVAPDGTIYFTDLGTMNGTNGRLWRLTPSAEQIKPETITIIRGEHVSGDVTDMFEDDNSYYIVKRGRELNLSGVQIMYDVVAHATAANASKLEFNLVSSSTLSGVTQKIFLFNYTMNKYDLVDTRTIGTSESSVTITITANPEDYIQDSSFEVKSRIQWIKTGFAPANWQTKTDKVRWQRSL
ncbi:MAG TPA: hypothetical protein VNK96_10155 [Fimbriimonadales bacterium]|nr:hypothetical protein [Fimbriimonadales bacterium]